MVYRFDTCSMMYNTYVYNIVLPRMVSVSIPNHNDVTQDENVSYINRNLLIFIVVKKTQGPPVLPQNCKTFHNEFYAYQCKDFIEIRYTSVTFK